MRLSFALLTTCLHCRHLTPACSFLVHAVRWNDDAASPRSPTDDGLQSSDGGVAGPQFAHSSCDRDLRGA
jgi:hypothetical protein